MTSYTSHKAYAPVVQAICCFANQYKFESWIVKTVVQPLGWKGSQLNAKKFIFSWNMTLSLRVKKVYSKHLFLYVTMIREKARRSHEHFCSLIFKDCRSLRVHSSEYKRSTDYYFLIICNHNRESLLLNLFWSAEL